MSAPAAPAPAPVEGAEAKRFLDVVLRVRELSLVGVIGLLVLGTTLYNERFVNSQNLRDISLNVAIVAMLAVGQTIVVVSRNIDLSVGSVLGFTALAVGSIFADNPGISIPVVIVLGILIGAGFGAINGALVSLGRVPSLVVTIGTLYIIRGANFAWAEGRQVNAADMPEGFLNIGSANLLLGIPVLPVITIVVMVVAGFYLRSYRAGRELYAIGSNPDAAVLAGIPVSKRVFWSFVASGALAGLAGVLYAARYGTIDAAAGTGFELGVVAAVVVGGVAIFGGAGTVYGAVLGAVLLSTISSALVILRIDPFWNQAINGALLLVAISIDRLLGLRVERALKKRSSRNG